MASVSYTFNLDLVSSAATSTAATSSAESSAAIGASYDSAQTSVHSASSLPQVSSPACTSGDCFVIHSEGPGVTTLSIGEEDGGFGEFISLPVVDGSLFLEPPVTSFAGGAGFTDPNSATGYEVSTLAIGEEDGGLAAAPAEIGGEQSIYAAGQEPVFTMQPIYDSQPAPVQVAAVPIGSEETTLFSIPIPKPAETGASIEAVQVATANSPLPPLQTVPIVEPRAKPVDLAGTAFPVPEVKPDAMVATAAAPLPTDSSAAVTTDSKYVSVGDYDSYLASMAVPESGVSELAVAAVPPSGPSADNTDSVMAIYNPPPPAPEPSSSSRIEVVLHPVPKEVPTSVAGETIVSPTMKPANFTTSEPTTLASIQTVPIEVEVELPSTLPEASSSGTVIGPSFVTVDAPLPAGKPDAVGAETPRLSEEDFRISTLALGEEESGGG